MKSIKARIDRIDEKIIGLLGQRLKQCALRARTGENPPAENIQVGDIQKRIEWGKKQGLDTDVIDSLYRDLSQYFERKERELRLKSERNNFPSASKTDRHQKLMSSGERARRKARMEIQACRLSPKESPAAIAARQPIHRRLDFGEIYGGFFKNMPANKKGYAMLVILADEGKTIKVVPILSSVKPGRGAIPVKSSKDFTGSISIDETCSIDKRLLLKKFGRINDETADALESALLERTMTLPKVK